MISLLQLAALAQTPQKIQISNEANVVVFVADDVGYFDLEGLPLPNLQYLASQGVVFTNAYANPTCSPSRRAAMVGEFFDRDSGDPCSPPIPSIGPFLEQTTLAELDPNISSGWFGKWHVGPNPTGGPSSFAPEPHGWDTWRAWHPLNVPNGFNPVHPCQSTSIFDWRRVDDGIVDRVQVYEPIAVSEAFQGWWVPLKQQKIAWVAPQLAHGPFHAPPASLLPPGWVVGPTILEKYQSMIVAMDTIVGQVTSVLDFTKDIFIFVGDNGTPNNVSPDPNRSKSTTYERGIHVPMIVAGPGFPKNIVRSSLVHIVDVHATVAQAIKVPNLSTDSIPLQSTTGHEWIISGHNDDHCVRTLTRKLRKKGTEFELFDLVVDPQELVNVYSLPEYEADVEYLTYILNDFLNR